MSSNESEKRIAVPVNLNGFRYLQHEISLCVRCRTAENTVVANEHDPYFGDGFAISIEQAPGPLQILDQLQWWQIKMIDIIRDIDRATPAILVFSPVGVFVWEADELLTNSSGQDIHFEATIGVCTHLIALLE